MVYLRCLIRHATIGSHAAAAADAIADAGSSRSYQYFFPFRAVLIILRAPSVRNTATNFVRTMYAARKIFFLYAMNLIAACVFGLVLFREQ